MDIRPSRRLWAMEAIMDIHFLRGRPEKEILDTHFPRWPWGTGFMDTHLIGGGGGRSHGHPLFEAPDGNGDPGHPLSEVSIAKRGLWTPTSKTAGDEAIMDIHFPRWAWVRTPLSPPRTGGAGGKVFAAIFFSGQNLGGTGGGE